MIGIKSYNIDELIELVNSEEFNQWENIPISRHRALSYFKNPRINNEDKVLFIAFMGEKIVGYRTILSDYLFINDSKIKFGWLSGNWVHKKYRRKGISTSLVNEVNESWKSHLLTTNNAPTALAVNLKSALFDELYSINGIRFYFRLTLATLLPPKSTFFHRIKLLLRLIDLTFNIFNDLILLIKFLKYRKQNFEFDFINNIDKETEEFIRSKENSIFIRQKEELEWIIQYPWVLNNIDKDVNNSKYHFSSTSKSFHVYNIKVYDKKENLVAFMMLKERDHKVDIPYLFYDELIKKDLPKIIYYLSLKLRAKYLSLYNKKLISFLKDKNGPFFYKKKIVRKYLATQEMKDLLKNYSSFNIQDGDGDCAFT